VNLSRCGWGTLVAFAAKNYGVDATGVTLGRNQTAFGNKRIADNGVSADQARILCMDYREIPDIPGSYKKIVSLEMAEVCISIRSMGSSPNLSCFYSMSVFVATTRSCARSITSSMTMVSSSFKLLASVPRGNMRISSGVCS
jgi:hypothetical protein